MINHRYRLRTICDAHTPRGVKAFSLNAGTSDLTLINGEQVQLRPL